MASSTTLLVRPLDYTAMRMLRFRAALTDFLRRWGIYLVVVVVLFSAGTNAPVAIAAGLAGLLVQPLRVAAVHGVLVVPATLAYAAVGTLPVVLTRPLWWPRRWAAVEHALPLDPRVIRRSDRLFAALLMTPWQAVLALGCIASWLGEPAPGDAGVRVSTLAAWAVSAAASLQSSILWMRVVRRRAADVRRGAGTVERHRARRSGPGRLGFRRALILSPMLRGRARRSALATLVGPVVTFAVALVPRSAGASTGWAFAFAACAALCFTSVLRTSTIRELRPFWAESRQLPLAPKTCERARLAVTLSPLGACALACVAAALLAPSPLRPQVCALYGLVVAAGCVLEALTPPTMSSSDHAARWLLMLVAALAFASEISPS